MRAKTVLLAPLFSVLVVVATASPIDDIVRPTPVIDRPHIQPTTTSGTLARARLHALPSCAKRCIRESYIENREDLICDRIGDPTVTLDLADCIAESCAPIIKREAYEIDVREIVGSLEDVCDEADEIAFVRGGKIAREIRNCVRSPGATVLFFTFVVFVSMAVGLTIWAARILADDDRGVQHMAEVVVEPPFYSEKRRLMAMRDGSKSQLV